MKYKITDINKEQGWISLIVTFDDGSTYSKKMMANMENEESVHADIQSWLANYIEVKAEESKFDPNVMKNKITLVEELPKSSKVIASEAEAEAAKLKELQEVSE